jgi:hypothetical protein
MESLRCLAHHSRVTLKRRSQKGSLSVAICKRHFSGKAFPLASAGFADPRHTPFSWDSAPKPQEIFITKAFLIHAKNRSHLFHRLNFWLGRNISLWHFDRKLVPRLFLLATI